MDPAAEIARILRQIADDKSDGATSLAARGLDALELLAATLDESAPDALERAAELAARVDALRPSMAAVGVQAVLAVVRARGLAAEGLGPRAALERAVRVERETLGQANVAIADRIRRELGRGGVIATCSFSVTALRALVAVDPERVCIGEGHRLADGMRAARWLAARGLEVEVVPDGALPGEAAGARAVLVGADQVLADGSVVNRCSTFPLALAALRARVPFYVACQRIKLAGAPRAEIEQAPAFFSGLPEGVRGRVPLFDVTPPDLVSGVFTESGRLEPDEAGAVGAHVARLRERVTGRRA